MSSVNSLSDRQKAILTEIGVTPWQLRVSPNRQEEQPEQPAGQTSPQTPIQQGANINVTNQPHPLVADVLRYLQKSALPTHFGSSESFSFEWSVGNACSYDGKQLVTPPIDVLVSPETKKALWDIIQHANE